MKAKPVSAGVSPSAIAVLVVPAEIGSVPVVRAALSEALDAQGWEQDSAFRVLLATSEATANAVKHGSCPGDLVEVSYTVGERKTTVRVLDGGPQTPWTPPENTTMAEPGALQGRGLAMIVDLAEHFELRRLGRGTEMRLDFLRSA